MLWLFIVHVTLLPAFFLPFTICILFNLCKPHHLIIVSHTINFLVRVWDACFTAFCRLCQNYTRILLEMLPACIWNPPLVVTGIDKWLRFEFPGLEGDSIPWQRGGNERREPYKVPPLSQDILKIAPPSQVILAIFFIPFFGCLSAQCQQDMEE